MPETPKGPRARKAKPAAPSKSAAGERTRRSRSPVAKKRAGPPARAAVPRAKAAEAHEAVAPAVGEATTRPGPQKAASGTRTITLLQFASGIGCPVRQKRVLRALGLRHPHHRVVRPDNPSVRGMVAAIPHLVRIVEGQNGQH